MNASVRLGAVWTAENVLESSVNLWFVIAFAGQFFFAIYIAVHYLASGAIGDFARWNETLIHPVRAGHIFEDALIGMHLIIGFVITMGGPVQLLLASAVTPGSPIRLAPRARLTAQRIHRVFGRVYVVTAMALSLGALYLTWTQKPFLFSAGPVASLAAVIAGTLNGVLIVLFALLAIRAARRGNIDVHRRWALRLFLVVGGVWFMRIGYGFLTVVSGHPPFGGGAPGTTANMDGTYDMFLGFGRVFVPLAVLELYLWVQRKGVSRGKWVMATTLVVATIVVGIGIVGAAKLMWLPFMVKGL